MLHHIELYVKDISITRQFYSVFLEKLGYHLYQEWDDGFSYRFADGTYMVFVQVPEKYVSLGYHRQRIGLNHLAFRVESTHEVDSIRQWLIERGVTLLYDERYPHAGGPQHYAVFFEDPDRVKIEVVGR